MSNLTDLINEFTAEAAVQSRAQQTQFESLKNDINAQMAGFGKQVDAKISAQAAKDAAARKAIVDNLGKLMYQGDIDKYLVTTWQSSSYHNNRKYFKIKFNPNRPGYFSCGAAEFRTACTALNTALRGSDGVDRALKPVCNHASFTDGNCVRLSSSYLSHCGCGGSYRRWPHCAGMPESFLVKTILYNRHGWHGWHHLSHNGVCSHSWRSCNGQHSSYPYTICTSSNG